MLCRPVSGPPLPFPRTCAAPATVRTSPRSSLSALVGFFRVCLCALAPRHCQALGAQMTLSCAACAFSFFFLAPDYPFECIVLLMVWRGEWKQRITMSSVCGIQPVRLPEDLDPA